MVDVNPKRTLLGGRYTRSQLVVLAIVAGGGAPGWQAGPTTRRLAQRGLLIRTRGVWALTDKGRAVAEAAEVTR